MEEKKDKELSFQDKFLKLLSDNLKIIMLTLVGGGYAGYKEYFEEEKRTDLKKEIVIVVKTDLKHYLDSLMDVRFMVNLEKSLNNPMIWLDALSTPYVAEFVEDEALEIKEEVRKAIYEEDSLQDNFVESIGKSLGIRDEDVIPMMKEMFKYYKAKSEIRTITAPF